MADERQRKIPQMLDQAAAWSWRLLVIAAAVLAFGFTVSRLRLVLLPLAAAFLLATVLVPPMRWLVRRGSPPLLATWIVVVTFLGTLAALGMAIVPPLVDEFGDLGPTLEDATDEVEDWLVDGPLDLQRSSVTDLRERLNESADAALSSDGTLVEGAVLVGELVTGAILTLVIAFFLVKDGERLQRWALDRIPAEHRSRARHVGAAAWSTLGRYLATAASLGAIEATIITIALTATGSSVVVPVATLTFLGAFFPFVGAIVAGIVAVLVALVSSGPGAAVVVAVVAVLVQQFDNDLLAPVLYGRALRLHPLVVILSIATGAAIGGFLGAFLAVPVAAVVINASTAAAAPDDADVA